MIDYYVRMQKIDHIHVMASMTEEYNLDWNQINEDELTPLGMCVENNLLESAKALLNIEYVRVNQCGYSEYDPRINSPALLAMEAERKEMFSLLIKHPRTEVNNRYDNSGDIYTILLKSVERDDTYYLNELCNRKDIDIMQDNAENLTPLYSIIQEEKVDHLKVIVQHPRISFEPISDEESTLLGAIREGNKEIISILLKSGANPEEVDENSGQPLDMFHYNIFFCCNMSTNEEAEARRDIADILLDMGIRPKQNPLVLTALDHGITFANPVVINFIKANANFIYGKLTHDVRGMDYLARGHILKNLRNTARGKSIIPLLKALEKEQRLPFPCVNFLKFE